MDWRDVGLDIFRGAGTGSLAIICNDWGTGRAGEPRSAFDCGGGVGKALGGMAGELSINADLVGPGENGGVGAGGRGVEPLDPGPGGPWIGVLLFDMSPDLGVSVL